MPHATVRIAIGCGLALGGAALLRVWWERLRRRPAETDESSGFALQATDIRAGPFGIFARSSIRPPSAAGLPPVVLVHGLVVSSRMVEPLAATLSRHGFRVLAPDLPGFGESTKPPRPLDVPALADALALWLHASGIARATLLGASFGCHVIVELALRHPALVDRLILQGPGPDPVGRRLPRAIWRQAVNSRREPRPLGPISRIDYAKAGLRRAAATLRLALRYRIEDKLPLVPVPTLVVRGSRDVIVPQAWAEHLARLLPRGRLAIVEGGSHVLSYGAPEELAGAILPFLREAVGSPGRGQATIRRGARWPPHNDGSGSMAMQVQEIMQRDVQLADPNMTIRDVARRMRADNIGALPVGENDRLVGMVTDRDIVVRAVAEERSAGNTTVREVMSEGICYCFDDEDVQRAAEVMSRHQVRRLPVLNREKRLVGVVALADLGLTEEKDAAQNALQGISEPTDKERR